MDGTSRISQNLTSFEVCAGAGGQSLGLERAGFDHIGLSEIERHARDTLRLNRPTWNVLEGEGADIKTLDARPFQGIDLLAGGLPCPPFSKAGKQLGKKDERNLFPDFVRIVDECRPTAIMVENVRGFLDAGFDSFRKSFARDLKKLGYKAGWRLFNASDFGVSQLRPRVVIVALQAAQNDHFNWPEPNPVTPPHVGPLLLDLMAADGWEGAANWAKGANAIAPTIVGGSHKHGGPDLGPTRARAAWAKLGVDGKSIANEAPAPGFVGPPRLTTRMVARLQGFPDDWQFSGKKTPAYRQIGNAFPAPVAEAVGQQLIKAITHARHTSRAVA